MYTTNEILYLVEIAKLQKLTVTFDSPHVRKGLRGTILFAERHIHIATNEDENAVKLTLLHELGHWLGMVRSIRDYGNYPFWFVHHRIEMDAYRFGWVLAKRSGISLTKKEWREDHAHEITEFVKLEGRRSLFASPLKRKSAIRLIIAHIKNKFAGFGL